MGENLISQSARLVAQLSIILIAAKIGAELCERYLKQPAVLGELLAGVFLSPYLFGSAIPFFSVPIHFIKYAAASTLVAIGGVVLPFFAGAYITTLFDNPRRPNRLGSRF